MSNKLPYENQKNIATLCQSVKNLVKQMDNMQNNHLVHLQEGIDDIKDSLDVKFVSSKEFKPVQMIAYGLVGIICSTVLAFLLSIALNA